MHSGWRTPALIVIVALILGPTIPFSPPHLARATSSPSALDGLGSSINCGTGLATGSPPFLSCVSDSISTTSAGDAIIVLAECGYRVPCYDNISSVFDQTGLSFVPRIATPPNGQLMEYYAVAPTILMSDNVTVEFYRDPCCCIMQMLVLAVSGVSASATFDPSPSIPATSTCNVTSTAYNGSCSITANTSTSGFVFATVAINDDPSCIGTPSGFARTYADSHSFPSDSSWDIYYATDPVPPQSLTFNCDGTQATGMLLDALSLGGAADPPAAPGGGAGRSPLRL